jgi:hypothetical protein
LRETATGSTTVDTDGAASVRPTLPTRTTAAPAPKATAVVAAATTERMLGIGLLRVEDELVVAESATRK